MKTVISIFIFLAHVLLILQTTSYGNDFFRGHLILGHEVRSFTPCEKKVDYWVYDQTGGDLWEVYQRLTHQPYQPIYVEVRGRLGPPPVDGFGADYDKPLIVQELRRAGLETRGCAEDLRDISFRASGNEPFWNARISENEILISELRDLMDRKWALRSFGTIGSEERILPDTEISIEFAADGRLNGSGGCNRYFASYEIGPGDSFTIKQIGSTRMACPQEIMDQEMKYFESLQSVSTFKVQNHLLQLFYRNGEQVLIFSISIAK